MLENGQMNSWVTFPRTENRMDHLQLQISKILFHAAVVSRGDWKAGVRAPLKRLDEG